VRHEFRRRVRSTIAALDQLAQKEFVQYLKSYQRRVPFSYVGKPDNELNDIFCDVRKTPRTSDRHKLAYSADLQDACEAIGDQDAEAYANELKRISWLDSSVNEDEMCAVWTK
jgi:hypothetical protein